SSAMRRALGSCSAISRVAASPTSRLSCTCFDRNAGSCRSWGVSEGGEKFAHLLLNNMVSVSVFDDYQGISSLAGLQLQGVATIVNHEHHDYFSFMQFRGINPEKLPVKLNMISIKPSKVELLHHSLKTDGYSIRQIYRYPN
ncbi:MAG: hypothetical protein ACM3O9_03295, partial [Methylocystaceae bacterium]